MKTWLKKTIIITACLIMLLSVIGIGSLTASADTPTSGTIGNDVVWEYDKSTCSLTISGSGIIPDYSSAYVNGVNTSSAPWRDYYNELKKIVICDGITSIGKYSFYNCSDIDITIPGTVVSIGENAFGHAFYDHKKYSKVSFTGTVDQWAQIDFKYSTSTTTYGSTVYEHYSNPVMHSENLYINNVLLTNAVISEAKRINAFAFYNCNSLESLKIGDKVESIENYSFYNCASLKSLTIGNKVESIGEFAFDSCSEISSIIIPDCVTSIGKMAFCKCSSLSSLVLPNNIDRIEYGAFAGCSNLTKLIIPENIIYIKEAAFRGCKGLVEVVIPNSVKQRSTKAFENCSSLIDITIPDSVSAIGINAFYNEENGTVLFYSGSANPASSSCGKWGEKSVYKYYDGDLAFSSSNKKIIAYCKKRAKEVIIPDGVTGINDSAFSNCSEITSITIPGSVTSISYNAFSDCTELKTAGPIGGEYDYEFGWTTAIPSNAFSGCNELESVKIPEGITEIGACAFDGCSNLTTITIPNSVTNINNNAFSNCPLEYVKMGSGLTNIPSTLINKDNLKTFIIGNGVTSIDISTFKNCTGLSSINIPNSVTSIGSSAFYGCTSLTTITLPTGITRIGESAFYNTAYYNNASNWSDNMLYIGNYLIKGKTDLAGNKAVKSGTTCIADSALSGCSKIITLTVPDSVNYIGINAFGNVTNVAYTGTATGSPWGARCLNGYTDGNFVYSDSGKAKLVACSGLATGSVIIPASTDTIGNSAFSACSTLTNIYIPVNVTRIGNSAFSSTALSDVYYEGSTVDKLGISFGDNNSRITDATWHYNSKKSDMPQAAVYTLTYNANGGSGAPGKQTGSGYVTISNTKPTRSGYTFLGWATGKSATSAQYNAGSLINLDKDITLYAVWQKNNTPDNPDPPSTDIPEANVIKGNSADNKKTYNYRTTVTFTANVPEGGSVQWYVDGSPAGNGSTLTVKDKINDYTVKVVVTDKNGNKTMDEEQVTIKHGFFDIIIWFFVHLFNPGAYDVKQ